MSLGRKAWKDTRKVISNILSENNDTLRDNEELKELALVSMENAEMEFPVDIGDYTDFYSSKEEFHEIDGSLNIGQITNKINDILKV